MEPSATGSPALRSPDLSESAFKRADAPVLDRPAPLSHLHDSGTGYKYLDLLTYFFTYFCRLSITETKPLTPTFPTRNSSVDEIVERYR